MSQDWLVGTRKGLFRIEQHNGHYQVAQVDFLGVQVPMVLSVPAKNQAYAALKHGHFGSKLHRSDDSGRTWREINPPTYPTKPDDVPDVMDPMRNTPIPWSLDMIWSLECGSDGRLWCGTLPGGLFTSDDCGESWQLNRPLWDLPNRARWFGGGYDLPGIHSICIHPQDPKQVSIGISCGGVWVTNDGGESWTSRTHGMRAEYMPPEQAYDPDIQDPHRLVQCTSQPDCMWVQHHNGIFRTTNAGHQWEEFAPKGPEGFGFAVAVHPNDPNLAWFVPAVKDSDRYPKDGRFVVCRTADGGKTFETLHQGLPQQHAYHLVYRHALEIDPAGNTLAMASTTGSLWVSQDLGDHWQTVTQDLPPAFVVRTL